MSVTVFIGIIGGVMAIFFANHLEGSTWHALVKSDAAVIVFGGTFFALMTHGGMKGITNAFKHIGWAIRPPVTDAPELIAQIAEWADKTRKGSFLDLESDLEEVKDPFVRTGLDAVVNNMSVGDLRDLLFQAGDVEDRENIISGEIWEAAGGYAPTIGVLGAVMGLIQVMEHLDQPSKLGPGIAAAFVATIYGVGSANMIFLPLGARLKKIAGARAVYRNIAIEGLLLLKKQESPMRIRDRLENMLESRRRFDNDSDGGKDEDAREAA